MRGHGAGSQVPELDDSRAETQYLTWCLLATVLPADELKWRHWGLHGVGALSRQASAWFNLCLSLGLGTPLYLRIEPEHLGAAVLSGAFGLFSPHADFLYRSTSGASLLATIICM